MPGHAKHIGYEAEPHQRRHTSYGIRESESDGDNDNACVESSDNDTAHDSFLQAMSDGNDKRICKRAASGFL